MTKRPKQTEVPSSHIEVLRERLEEERANPESGETWDVVRDRLRSKICPIRESGAQDTP